VTVHPYDHDYYEGLAHNNQGCNRPPPGWWCSREPDHDGPCAARPVPPKPKPPGLVDVRDYGAPVGGFPWLLLLVAVAALIPSCS